MGKEILFVTYRSTEFDESYFPLSAFVSTKQLSFDALPARGLTNIPRIAD